MTSIVTDSKALPAIPWEEFGFTDAAYDSRFQASDVLSFYPTTAISQSDKHIRILLPKIKAGWAYDLSEIKFQGTINIHKADNTVLPADSKISTINNIWPSAFKTMNIYFNNVLVQYLPFHERMNYLLKRLETPASEFDTYMTNSGYYADSIENADSVDPDVNDGWDKRRNRFGSKVNNAFVYGTSPVYFESQICTYLPKIPFMPEYEIVLELEINDDNTFFFTDGTQASKDCSFSVQNLVAKVPANHFVDSVYVEIKRKIDKRDMTFNYRKLEVNWLDIPTGTLSQQFENITLGRIPEKMIVFFQNNKRARGDKALNTLRFQQKFNEDNPENTFGIKKVDMVLSNRNIDGFQQTSWTKNNFRDEYGRLFNIMGPQVYVTYEEFMHSFFVLVYDFTLTNGKGPDDLIPVVKTGFHRLSVELTKVSTEPIVMFVVLMQQATIKITANGTIIRDSV